MSVRAAADQIHKDISAAIAAGQLPDPVREKADRILQRLSQPVRVSVMGLPQSGKSSLINLLIGDDVIPMDATLPTIQFSMGDSPSVVVTLPTGAKKSAPHANLTKVAALNPMYVEAKLPLPALGRISLLEVVAPATSVDMRRAMGWASKRTDIAIWCSNGFSVEEQTLWAAMPDAIKDHAFLLMTRADEAQQSGHLEQLLARVTQSSADQFNKIMPIATPLAISARGGDGKIDKGTMQRSGGLALVQAVLRQVDMGLRSTVDQAELLLHPYRDAKPAAKAAPKPAPAKPAATKPAIAAVPDTPKPAAEPAAAMASKTARPAPVAVPDAPAAPARKPGFMPKAKKTVVPSATPATCAAYKEAIAYLSGAGDKLAKTLAAEGEISPHDLMASAADNIMWLSDFLEDLPVKGDSVLDRGRATALDASDLVQLMQLEDNDEVSAMDALSLVIQLKHDLSADVAFADHKSQDKAA